MNSPEVVLGGYSSMDRIVKVATPLQPGFTSLVTNKDNAHAYVGGCPVNIAYGLAALGHESAPLVRVGDDEAGAQMVAFLAQGRVRVEQIGVVEDECTPNCYLVEDKDGNHVTIFYPGAMHQDHARPFDDAWFAGARLAVLTVGSQADNREFLRQAKRHGVPLAFGMKADLDAFPQELLREILDYSTVIFLNHSERSTIQDMFALDSVTQLFDSGNLKHLIVTDGTQGSHCYTWETGALTRVTVPIVNSEGFVDAIGAGDAYMAGYLSGYLHGQPSTMCAQMGSTLASFVVERAGACTGYPTLLQFHERLAHAHNATSADKEETE